MSEIYTPANLFAGSSMPIVSGTMILASGQNLARGSVLGKVTKALGSVVSGSNTGDGELSGIALGARAQIGSYALVCIAAPSGAGANDAVFAVYAPDGSRLEDAVQGVAYANGHLEFTIGNATAADFAVDDSFAVPVTAGSGYAKLVDSANVDGSAEPVAILADDVDATGGDKPAPVYLTGEFNEDALTFGGSDDADTHRDALRDLGILLKTIG
jgi:hypothetical protein